MDLTLFVLSVLILIILILVVCFAYDELSKTNMFLAGVATCASILCVVKFGELCFSTRGVSQPIDVYKGKTKLIVTPVCEDSCNISQDFTVVFKFK